MNSFTVSRLLAVLVIAGIAFQELAVFHRAPGVDQYHALVRARAEAVPSRIGPWVGQDVPMRVQALTVLHPNVLISRRYTNIETGDIVAVLLVHCADAHSMVGHFPARCYPAQGWTLARSAPKDWMVGDLKLTGTEYEFTMDDPVGMGRGPQDIIVANCLLRPGGLVLRDMDSMSNSIIGAYAQSMGAGQLQVIFDASVPREKRDATICEIAAGYRPVIDAILSKPKAN